MFKTQRISQARTKPLDKRMIVDCRGMDFSSADSMIAWVMNFPSPASMHVVLPSSAPQMRRLQCTLQGLGCVVSRVTNFSPVR